MRDLADVNSARELSILLRGYSAEVTSGDRKSIEDAARLLEPGSEVFIASLPSDTCDRQIAAAVRLRESGLTPVPHVAARNIKSADDFNTLLSRFVAEAGVDRVLLLAGDRHVPAGTLTSSLDLLRTELLPRHGIERALFSWYPEVHPKILTEKLAAARRVKLALAADQRLQVTLVSQFCFESAPIIRTARQLRADGVTAPLRIGVAGPASRASLLKYAILCGVGASIRALKERPAARNMLTADTPEDLLSEVALANAADESLGITGVHFFTFASLARTAEFAEARRQRTAPETGETNRAMPHRQG